MKVVDNNIIHIKLPKPRISNVIRERRDFLHKKLGMVCMDCGAVRKPGKNGMLNMHHIFYPLGYEPNWTNNWKYASDDVFYSSYYPEIMEACVLLCRACHRKRHGIKKAS